MNTEISEVTITKITHRYAYIDASFHNSRHVGAPTILQQSGYRHLTMEQHCAVSGCETAKGYPKEMG